MPIPRNREAEDLALRLFARGARNKIVEHHTGLSPYVLRNIRRSLGYRRATAGPIPYLGGTFVASREIQIHGSLFAAAYRRLGGTRVAAEIEVDAMIAAYDIYRRLVEARKRLSFNDAWVIARDLRGGGVALVPCANCAVDYLSCESSRAPPTCPYCALYHRHGIGRQAAGRRTWSEPKC